METTWLTNLAGHGQVALHRLFTDSTALCPVFYTDLSLPPEIWHGLRDARSHLLSPYLLLHQSSAAVLRRLDLLGPCVVVCVGLHSGHMHVACSVWHGRD